MRFSVGFRADGLTAEFRCGAILAPTAFEELHFDPALSLCSRRRDASYERPDEFRRGFGRLNYTKHPCGIIWFRPLAPIDSLLRVVSSAP